MEHDGRKNRKRYHSVYNVEDYLEKVCDHFKQTYTNKFFLSMIVPTDNNGELCDQLSSKRSAVRVILKENGETSETSKYRGD